MTKIRRFEAKEGASTVWPRVKEALGNGAITLSLDFADVFEGPLPIPENIEQTDVTFDVTDVWSRKKRRGAFGLTLDGRHIRVFIPRIDEDRVTVLVPDLPAPSPSESSEAS